MKSELIGVSGLPIKPLTRLNEQFAEVRQIILDTKETASTKEIKFVRERVFQLTEDYF